MLPLPSWIKTFVVCCNSVFVDLSMGASSVSLKLSDS